MSLRQIREELTHTYIGPLALRTLNERLHQLATLDPNREAEDVPPIIQVDAIWITLFCANGEVRRDRKGRKRPVKGRFKVPIMIAMGVWPDSDRCEILFWRLGESESASGPVKHGLSLLLENSRGGSRLSSHLPSRSALFYHRL